MGKFHVKWATRENKLIKIIKKIGMSRQKMGLLACMLQVRLLCDGKEVG